MKQHNKPFKIIMIVGVVLLIIGLIISLIGYLTGGVYFSNDWYHNDSSYSSYWGNVTDYEMWTETPIESVSIKLAYGKIDFAVSTTKAGIEIKNYAKDVLTLEMVDNELRVHDNRWSTSITDFTSKAEPVITVYLNQETLQNITVEFGAGTVNLSKMNADIVSISLGAGNLSISDVVATSFTLESGAGDATFTNCTIGSFVSESGAGNLSFSGDIATSANIECGAGNVKFSLNSAESNYAFDISYGVGTFKVNGHNHSGFGGSDTINPAGPVKITVSAGVGDVTIQTA